MTTKTLSISEEAYNNLKGLKQGNESFTDLIIRLTEKEMKGISIVLDWLETMSKDDESSLVELTESVEAVVSTRNKDKWRPVEI